MPHRCTVYRPTVTGTDALGGSETSLEYVGKYKCLLAREQARQFSDRLSRFVTQQMYRIYLETGADIQAEDVVTIEYPDTGDDGREYEVQTALRRDGPGGVIHHWEANVDVYQGL